MIQLQARRRAFTLVEIMVVVIVLAILAAAVLPNVLGQGRDNQARVAVAQTEVSGFVTALNGFRMDMRRYPTESEGLAALRTRPENLGESDGTWRGPYWPKPIQKDPWGHDYVYSCPAPNGVDEFGVMSFGADGTPGGTSFNTDICSWENYDPNGGNQATQ
ncbi:type II secretion system major pseudopilin GspG [bacterium]|nr:type II secretion system major pseudopilin GspG [bacterium]